MEPQTCPLERHAHEGRHDAWIRTELTRRRENPGALIPHDEVVRGMEERLAHWSQPRKAAS